MFVFQPKLTEVHTYVVAYTALILMPIGLFNLGFFVSSLWSLVGKKGYGSKSLIIFFWLRFLTNFQRKLNIVFLDQLGFYSILSSATGGAATGAGATKGAGAP